MLFIILIVFLSCSTQEQPSEYVNIPDESLAHLLRHNLKLEDDEPISEKRLKELTELELGWSKPKILDLTGLEKATGLTSLRLTHAYDISEITPLAKLTNLQTLAIYDNSISDISPLAELTQLKSLTLLRGYTHDITPISNLTQLTELRIAGNPITDITPLSGLTQLTKLSLYSNPLRDISPLADLKSLTDLHLSDNNLSDISPLAGLTQLKKLSINENMISDLTPLTGLTELTELWLYENPLNDISPLANLKKLTALEFRDPLPDISPLSELTQLKSLKFQIPPPEIESLATLTQLTSLEFYDSNISDISPLIGLTELRTLKLYRNQIEDITPLSGMTKLEKLELYRNNISDISLLARLTQLTELRLDGNKIIDISPLIGLTQLTVLGLERNQIRNIKPLENLNNLKFLYLKHNPVQDVSPIQKLFSNNNNLNNPESLYPKHRPAPYPRVFHQHETRTGLPEGAIARLGKGGINVMRFSPDGKHLAIGSDVGVWVYDVATGEEIPLPNKVIGQVNAIAFSSDNRILACGGYLRPIIQLWNLETGIELPSFTLPVSMSLNMDIPIHSALALAFSINESTFTCVSHTGFVTIWDMTTGEKIAEHYTDSDDWAKGFAATEDGRMFARGYGNGAIWLWNTRTGSREAKMRGHKPFFGGSKKNTGIRALAFSSDGNTFASGSEDMTVRLWNTKRRSKRATLKGHTGWVTAVAFSKDGNTVASGDTDGTVRVWDVRKKRERTTLKGHTNGILALAFAPDGKTLASGSADGTVRFWNPNTGDVISTFASGYTEWVRSMAFSTDNTTLSTAMFNNTVQKYDVKTGNKLSEFSDGQQKLVHAVALSPDGTHLACHPVQGIIAFNAEENWKTDTFYQGHEKIQLWNLDTGKELSPLMQAFGKMAFSPDNKMLACSSSEDLISWNTFNAGSSSHGSSRGTYLWNVMTGNKMFHLNIERSDAYAPISFSPDGTKLVSSDRSDTTYMWNVHTQKALHNLGTGAEALAFSLDSKLLATKESRNIFIWNTTSGALVRNIDPHTIKGSYSHFLEGAKGRALAISPDGDILLVASVGRIFSFCIDQIDLIDIETGKKLLSLPGHTEPIETLLFSHDGKTLASGSQDGTVLLWDWDKIVRDVMLENKWPNER